MSYRRVFLPQGRPLKGLLAALAALMLAAALGDAARAQTPGPLPLTPNAPKKRLAVLDFDYATVTNWWGGDWNVGRGISALLVNELVKDGRFSLVERNRLDAVLKEQDLSNSGIADPKTASQLGKVLGVNALVTGSVTQFGFDDKSIGLNGNLGGLGGGMFGGLGGLLGHAHKQESKAIVVVTARLIDPSTAEILASAEGKGESARGSWGGFGDAWGRGGDGGAGIDMGSSNFQNTIVGEATRKCVEALAVQLEAKESAVGSTHLSVVGKVADVDGRTLIVNVGQDAGLSVGDTLSVERVTREVKDPDTGKVLREVTVPVGTLHITEVDAKSATGTFSGEGAPKLADRVKSR